MAVEVLVSSSFVSGVWLLFLQTQIEVPTSYADSGVYTFSRVFRASQSIEDVFHSTLPIVMDCALGVNGAILVRFLCFDCAVSILLFSSNYTTAHCLTL